MSATQISCRIRSPSPRCRPLPDLEPIPVGVLGGFGDLRRDPSGFPRGRHVEHLLFHNKIERCPERETLGERQALLHRLDDRAVTPGRGGRDGPGRHEYNHKSQERGSLRAPRAALLLPGLRCFTPAKGIHKPRETKHRQRDEIPGDPGAYAIAELGILLKHPKTIADRFLNKNPGHKQIARRHDVENNYRDMGPATPEEQYDRNANGQDLKENCRDAVRSITDEIHIRHPEHPPRFPEKGNDDQQRRGNKKRR